MHEYARACGDLGWLAMEVLGYPDLQVPGLHVQVAEFLDRPGRRKLLLLPRDHLKTTVGTIAATVQAVLRTPAIRILLANHTWDNARLMLGAVARHFESTPRLREIAGEWVGDPWTRDEITVSTRPVPSPHKEPTVDCAGMEKASTSRHYDRIVADDLVDRINITTPAQIQKVKDYYRDLTNMLEPDGELWVLGTRWTEADLYGDILKGELGPFDTLVQGAQDAEDRPIYPRKFPLEVLAQKRRDLGPYLYACQFENNPISESAGHFKRAWFQTYTEKELLDPTTQKPTPLRMTMTIDPAISEAESADESAINVCGQHPRDRRMYVREDWGGRVSPTVLVDTYVTMAKHWRPIVVGVEKVAWQAALLTMLEDANRLNGIHARIVALNPHRSGKSARVMGLVPYLERGEYRFPEHGAEQLIAQLAAWPRGRHDDRVDALAYQQQLKLILSEGGQDRQPKTVVNNPRTGY